MAMLMMGMTEQSEIVELGASSPRPGPDVVDLEQVTGGAAPARRRIDV
ncbi:MAG: hypothetical protein OXC31_18020 [Spirochaetaceae bacterium]|nr:hypothetical protein [Spirochaetaceae bacterium]